MRTADAVVILRNFSSANMGIEEGISAVCYIHAAIAHIIARSGLLPNAFELPTHYPSCNERNDYACNECNKQAANIKCGFFYMWSVA